MSGRARTGWVLLVLGVASLALGTLQFPFKQEVFSIGEFKASTTSERRLPELTYAGAGLALVGGILLLAGGGKRRGR